MYGSIFWIGWIIGTVAGGTPEQASPGIPARQSVGNRLSYLEAFCDPYYPHRGLARLSTPQWVGTPGVEAVVVLAIDDLRFIDPKEKRPEQFENFLRPILERLKKIDGRAPVSLMTTWFDKPHFLFHQWLEEGCTLEVHTKTHPCPLLQKQDFAKAKATYEQCVDQLAALPGNAPVAFRMPCCDSMNSPSPRFYAEIFNRSTPQGRFLQADSSIFLLFTSDDPTLPGPLVRDPTGQDRFRKYLPKDRLMGDYVENYPYPWVIDRLCWEVPALVPSDWEAFHAHGPKNPQTVEDWKAAVDLVVAKQGIWAMCFHPYEWIANTQVFEVVEYAAHKYPGKLLFLNLREVVDRLTRNALGGVPLRAPDGQDNGVRLLDLNADGWMDVVIGNAQVRQTRLWSPKEHRWIVGDFPVPIVQRSPEGKLLPTGVRFGVLRASGMASILLRNETQAGLWHFDGTRWILELDGLTGLEIGQPPKPIFTCQADRDQGVRLWDIDGDGLCELIVGGPAAQAVFRYQEGKIPCWQELPWKFPEGVAVVDAEGWDAGLRLADLNGDGKLDLVFSDVKQYLIRLFSSPETGWGQVVLSVRRSDPDDFLQQVLSLSRGMEGASAKELAKPPVAPGGAGRGMPAGVRLSILPPFVRADGTNNGASFAHGALWVQNEDTGGLLPHHVVRWTYDELLQLGQSPSSSTQGAGESPSESKSVPTPWQTRPCETCNLGR